MPKDPVENGAFAFEHRHEEAGPVFQPVRIAEQPQPSTALRRLGHTGSLGVRV